MGKIKMIVFIILVVAGIAAYHFYSKSARGYQDEGELSGAIECEESAVGSIEGGRVAEVFVKEGDAVKAGQPLARLENGAIEKSVEEAREAAAGAEAGLRMLRNGYNREDVEAARAVVGRMEQENKLMEDGTRGEQVDAARSDMEAAESNYELTEKTYERQSSLYEKGVVSRQTMDEALAAKQTAGDRLAAAKSMYEMAEAGPREGERRSVEKKLEEGRARLRLLEKGPRPEEIEKAEAGYKQALSRVRVLESRVAELMVLAPSDCIVDVMELNPGDIVAPGAEVARLVIGDDLWVDVFVPEDRLGSVSRGAKVNIYTDSFLNEKFSGTVDRVSRRAEFTPRNVQTPEGRATQVFRTRIRIVDASKRLRAGMPVTVKIGAAEK